MLARPSSHGASESADRYATDSPVSVALSTTYRKLWYAAQVTPDDKAEREHCFQTVTDFMRQFDSLAADLTDGCYEDVESQFSLLLLRERADQLTALQAKQEEQHKQISALQTKYQKAATERNALQAKYKRLETAARYLLQQIDVTDDVESFDEALASVRGALRLERALVENAAALADEETKGDK